MRLCSRLLGPKTLSATHKK